MIDLYIVHPKDRKYISALYTDDLIWCGENWDYVGGSQIRNVYVMYKPLGYDEFINHIVKPCMVLNGGEIIEKLLDEK